MRPIMWRVRVLRVSEVFVDVLALTPAAAEADAMKVPQVVSVFKGSAIRGDQEAIPDRTQGVED